MLGIGCRKGTSLRELRVRVTLRPICDEPGSRPTPGGIAAVQLVKHADAEPADGLPERKLVLGQLGQRINQRHHRVTPR